VVVMMGGELREHIRQWSFTTVTARIVTLGMLWFVLSEGEFRYWGLILIAVLGGAFASLILVPSSGLGWSIVGWGRFIPFFIGQSVMGGVDVALRAVAPTPRLDAGYVEFEFRLSHEPARVFVANVMSLMPGTLSVLIEGDRLRMHVLDTTMPAVERAREVEGHAARMFRLELSE
jgi:multicomponent Na+:H+ antiporter subunit E